jgi:hypothetical protein
MRASKVKDQWSVLQGEYNGKPMLTRLNIGIKPLVGNKSYPYRIGIAVPYINPQSNGLPSGEENLRFNDIEDKINNYFSKKQIGYLCVIITTNGMKEYMIYSKVDKISDLIDSLKQNNSDYDFQHYVSRDDGWEGYNQFLAQK